MKLNVIFLPVAVALTACGGTESFAPTTQNISIPANYVLTVNANNTVTLFDGTNNTVLNPAANASNGGFTWFVQNPIRIYVNDAGTAAIVSTGLNYGDPMGAILTRVGRTSMPVTGSGTFTGFSSAVWKGASSDASEGRVTLNVSFGTSTIDGSIDSRKTFGFPGTKPTIILNSGTISGAGFSGTTAGGFNGGIQAGTYTGLFTGANAEGIVGQWQYDTGTDEVQGVFYADMIAP